MRFGFSAIFLLVFAILQPACGSFGSIVTMTGESVTVQLHGGSREEAELLAVEDSAILCLVHDRSPGAGSAAGAGVVKRIPVQSIAAIEVSGFRNDNWWIGVALFQVLPAIGLGVAASSADADAAAIVGVALIPAVLTTVLYAASGLPTPEFRDPISAEALMELRKYARFAGTLTEAQTEELLRVHGRERSD
jgi:hypothetical protein